MNPGYLGDWGNCLELRKSEISILEKLLAESEKRAASRQAMLDAALAALDERDEKIPALQ